MIDGVLIIDKPAGITSHDVVSRLRRILKTKRIGHTGTLDPFATGVLVMLIGQSTRLAQFIDKDAKGYEAVVRFGFETDTGDATGSLKSQVSSLKSEVQSSKFKVQSSEFASVDELENVLKEFRGEIEQTPPMYSAKKVAGKKLYELARKGIEIERKPVQVTIYELEIIQPQETQRNNDVETEEQKPKTEDQQINYLGLETWDLRLRVSCSAGTYIRTLAEDIGRKIGTGAHLVALRRTRAGKFDLSKAVTIERLEEIVSDGKLTDVLISMNEALAHFPQVVLSAEETCRIQNGLKLGFEDVEIKNGQPVRMIDKKENLIAIGFYDSKQKFIQPRIVMV
ncbi:MAG: tRNA pseudouridine(55) synthase TruB [Acidobacteria bacterium]|jgi:tRNA pseudouridine55 synthase|nr:tRNA pseudouridine(55) synthase TruB [Acidobacteriota bacterium]